MVGHITRNCGRKGNGKGKDERRRQGKQQLRRDSDGRQEKERFRQTRRIHGEDIRKNRKVGDTKDRAGRAARSDTGHEKVDGASPASTRKRQTAEKSGEEPDSEEDGEVGGVQIVGNVEEIKDEEVARKYHTHTP